MPEPASILDAGCGTGHGLQILHRRWPTPELTAVDFAPAMLALARPGCRPLPGGKHRGAALPGRVLHHLVVKPHGTVVRCRQGVP
ncbi:MAG: methyltransferase domain-containing protein [Candidatus Accumulibacter sp.]|nr:methyltransferase domain-containing protein [Candidatus Accumulibacter propinquus]